MKWLGRPVLSCLVPLLAILALLACGGGGGGGASTPPPSASVTITPSTATVTASTTRQFAATVANASPQTVTWSVQEGTAGGTIDSNGLYTAPAAPGTYHVVATSTAVSTAAMTATITVVAPPAITTFIAAKNTLSTGHGTSLTAVFSSGTASVNQGIGTVSSGVPVVTGNLSATTTYLLSVTNAAGTTVTSQLTITVVPIPVISGFSANPAVIGSGGSSTLMGTFSGGTGAVDHGVGTLASGAGISTGALNATTVFTLTVTNAAGDAVSAAATVTVVTAPPVISAFTATPATITLGNSSTLAWTVSGQAVSSLTIDQGVGDVTAIASATAQVTPTTATTYTLTATNPMGSTQATATVNVVFAPSIASFTASPTTITPNATSMLTPVFAQGTGVITPGIGTVLSGVGISTGPLTAGTTYTLTVTNGAQDSVTQQLTVHVDPGTFTSAGNAMSAARIGHTCTLLANGKVLVAGGSNTTAMADEFDPAAFAGTGGFSVSGNGMASVRDYPSAVLLPSGKVLVLGGYNPALPLPRQLDSADLYDPATH
ncbi:MAG TPA: hypothetical protein VJ486_06695, partial [Geothrix sp.]|nr:hypothetical protein [Geothrix sp.]